MNKYTPETVHLAKGTTFTMFDDDMRSINPTAGKEVDCLLAEVQYYVGYTVKDINQFDPKNYFFCSNLSIKDKLNNSPEILLNTINIIADLIRVKGVFKWSDFVKATACNEFTEEGIGKCAFEG